MECLRGAKHDKSQPSGLFSIKESCLKGFQTDAAMCSSYDRSSAPSVAPLSFSQLESHLKRTDQGREREKRGTTGEGVTQSAAIWSLCVSGCVRARAHTSASDFTYLSVNKSVATAIALNHFKSDL